MRRAHPNGYSPFMIATAALVMERAAGKQTCLDSREPVRCTQLDAQLAGWQLAMARDTEIAARTVPRTRSRPGFLARLPVRRKMGASFGAAMQGPDVLYRSRWLFWGCFCR